MIGRPQRYLGVAILAAIIIVSASPALAYFEHVIASSRTDALGGAFVAVADDAAATWFNPAGLSGLQRFHLLATYRQPYSLSDVNEGFLVAAIPSSVGGFGVSWFYRGLENAMAENLVTLSFGRDLKRTAEDASLSVGATMDYARVSVSDRFNSADAAVTFGLSAHMRLLPMIGMGYSVRNLNEATLRLVDDGEGTRLVRRQAWGLSYFWENRMIVSYERRQDTIGEWHTLGGVELRLGQHARLRSGLQAGRATMGLGLSWSGIAFDVGVNSHESLGASYVFTIGYGPPPPVNPYAQAP